MGPEIKSFVQALMRGSKPSTLPTSQFSLKSLKHSENNPLGQSFFIMSPEGQKAGRIDSIYEKAGDRRTGDKNKPGVYIEWLQTDHVPKSKEVFGVESLTGGLKPADHADLLARQLPNWYAEKMGASPEVLRGLRITGAGNPMQHGMGKVPLYEKSLPEVWDQYNMWPAIHPNMSYPPSALRGGPGWEPFAKAGVGLATGAGVGALGDYLNWGNKKPGP